ncbi:MAG: hypothetical protein C4576_11375 [Desulfobacteraceae bacterium]|nr:MAG: hypothetical protein C4576_11375 [Desulfobacteraceae bacterium]
MTIRASDYPDLRLTRLQKLIERWKTPPSLRLMKLFGQDNWDSDNIKWETQIGNRGLTPFVAPGSPSPMTSPLGVGAGAAFAAFWKEKMFFGEEFLNNLRQPGTTAKYHTAQKRLASETKSLKNRCERRKEWMFAKMLCGASFTYLVQNGLKYTIDYDVPTDNVVSLSASRKWNTGASRNIVEDIFDAKNTMRKANGGKLSNALYTTDVMKSMIFDQTIQNLLSKSSFGDGDLFANPERVLASLLGIGNMEVYDEVYQLKAWLTAAVTASSTTVVYVDDPTDFEVGDTLYFYDVSARTKEGEPIESIDVNAGTVTVDTAPSTSYKAGEDFVYANKNYIPIDRFVMFCSTVEDEKIAEFANAPFDLDRHYGLKTDTHEEWDPDGIAVRVQNKGIPVLYQEDAVFAYTVH